jgi:hypothetical protein
MSKSPSEAAFIPPELYKKGLKRVFRYSGMSMQPTFRAGQLLYVRPDVQDVKPGDVVVYEREGRTIVHRVISIGEYGFITRGDNNQFADEYSATPGQLIGRVELNEYLGDTTSVRGAWQGLYLVRLGSVTRWLAPGLRLVFGWPYRLLKVSKIMVRIWKPAITKIHLETDTDKLVKYIYHMKTVATWDAERELFECLRPFDLIIFKPGGQK